MCKGSSKTDIGCSQSSLSWPLALLLSPVMAARECGRSVSVCVRCEPDDSSVCVFVVNLMIQVCVCVSVCVRCEPDDSSVCVFVVNLMIQVCVCVCVC